jgi:Uma2 family endonuclease
MLGLAAIEAALQFGACFLKIRTSPRRRVFMSTVQEKTLTIADLLEQLGDIPPRRVRLRPPPGQATEQDVIDIEAREDRLYELVDGTLVEKDMGYYESRLAMLIGHFLEDFLEKHDLGIVAGEAGMLRLAAGLVRIPDVSFVSWRRLPGRELPAEPMPDLAPDLAVEVLSAGNTPREMTRKLQEYFDAGVRLVWFVDPRSRTVTVYTSPAKSRRVTEEQTLDGGKVLPGFSLPLRTLFARAGKRRPK